MSRSSCSQPCVELTLLTLIPADAISIDDVVASGKVEGDLDIDPEVDAVGLILGVRGRASVDGDLGR